MLGTYLDAAQQRAPENPAAQKEIRYMIRRLSTTWGHKQAAVWLRDYSHREWAGMISRFYRPRWSAYFTLLSLYMDHPEQMIQPDWYEWEELFVYDDAPYETVPASHLKQALLNIASFLGLDQD